MDTNRGADSVPMTCKHELDEKGSAQSVSALEECFEDAQPTGYSGFDDLPSMADLFNEASDGAAETRAPVPLELPAPVPSELPAPVPSELRTPVPSQLHAPVPSQLHAPVLSKDSFPETQVIVDDPGESSVGQQAMPSKQDSAPPTDTESDDDQDEPPPEVPTDGAIAQRLRRIFKPRKNGTYLVSQDFVQQYEDSCGEGRLHILKMFEKSGYNPDTCLHFVTW